MSSKKRRKAHRKTLCQLELLFKGVREALMHDLSTEYTRKTYGMKERGKRDQQFHIGCPPYTFKKIAQLRDFDKRIIWKDDRSFEDLAEECFTSFVESQKRFNCPEPMNRRELLVIQKANEICTKILGEFSYDDWFDSCSFGKRAAVDLPRRKSYLDVRFKRLSGTDLQLAAFNHALARDIHLLRAVRKRCRVRKRVDTIEATAVPKSWKAARIIAPDTILGGFLSRGLGEYIRRRLEKNTHIDLANQQDRHRRWAQVASISGHLSTIDMSKASDSFVWRHIELIVPSNWHHALDIVRTRHCLVPYQDTHELSSYMLMGSGHTFPLQTLLFFCLAEATRTLLKCRGKVSVYGDDIIVPTRMSTQLIAVLSGLGFTINSEKSFYDKPDPERPSHTFFRESCGGDYKGGVDVRPYMPECDLQQQGQVPRNEYVAWCHKIINGLLNRWNPEEIPTTVSYLLREISNRKRAICFVPAWEVDHAGIKHTIPPYLTHGFDLRDVKYPRSVPVYWRLTFKRRKRTRNQEERPYVWYAYWLHRNGDGTSPGPILRKNANGSVEADLYSTPISLDGEPLKGTKGVFRWETTYKKDRTSRKTLVRR